MIHLPFSKPVILHVCGMAHFLAARKKRPHHSYAIFQQRKIKRYVKRIKFERRKKGKAKYKDQYTARDQRDGFYPHTRENGQLQSLQRVQIALLACGKGIFFLGEGVY